ncbi:hypothetical protein FUAX_26130 [Fulvitalea axinellae]|uniref:CYTH domain-containing protein n=1 Tax=Fulvitalea axinellae TaxID=1182444 RepID=A0AAU9DAZ6_9BACT|nr:hypothetical protein FUAX_26130 [Fulvitalea axinellae]
MATEIERKFLVNDKFSSALASDSERITQGYLSSAPERSVRIRIKGKNGFLTVKGPVNETGTSRFEWEKVIPVPEALELLDLCEPGAIDKTRFLVPAGPHTYEVDVFHGDNDGLIVAEVELRREDEDFEKPDWLAEEVTGDKRYYNSQLARKPFKDWD